jgi:hypothetical protein
MLYNLFKCTIRLTKLSLMFRTGFKVDIIFVLFCFLVFVHKSMMIREELGRHVTENWEEANRGVYIANLRQI